MNLVLPRPPQLKVGPAFATASSLTRFLDAQSRVYPQVLAELSAGQRQTEWMWFIFPQIAGLGRSARTTWFAIASMAEARAYAQHPVLGERLRECTRLVLTHKNRSAFQIFQSPDDAKFRASMTLFTAAEPEEPLFQAALIKCYLGKPDTRTLEILERRLA